MDFLYYFVHLNSFVTGDNDGAVDAAVTTRRVCTGSAVSACIKLRNLCAIRLASSRSDWMGPFWFSVTPLLSTSLSVDLSSHLVHYLHLFMPMHSPHSAYTKGSSNVSRKTPIILLRANDTPSHTLYMEQDFVYIWNQSSVSLLSSVINARSAVSGDLPVLRPLKLRLFGCL